ncbi:hypothetical protein CC80DRAFT_575997, partial [Byssothecium circinans]
STSSRLPSSLLPSFKYQAFLSYCLIVSPRRSLLPFRELSFPTVYIAMASAPRNLERKPCPLSPAFIFECGGVCEILRDEDKETGNKRPVLEKNMREMPEEASCSSHRGVRENGRQSSESSAFNRHQPSSAKRRTRRQRKVSMRFPSTRNARKSRHSNAPDTGNNCDLVKSPNTYCKGCATAALAANLCYEDGMAKFKCLGSAEEYEKYPFQVLWPVPTKCTGFCQEGDMYGLCGQHWQPKLLHLSTLKGKEAKEERYELSQCFGRTGNVL